MVTFLGKVMIWGQIYHFRLALVHFIKSTRKILAWVRPLPPFLAMPRFRKRLLLKVLPYWQLPEGVVPGGPPVVPCGVVVGWLVVVTPKVFANV